MSDKTQKIEILSPPEGMQFRPTDVDFLQNTIDNELGCVFETMGGYNLMPPTNYVTVVPASGMNVTLGGTGQKVVAQGLMLDTCPATNQAITAADGTHDRIDLICIKTARIDGSSTITNNVRDDAATPAFQVLTSTLVAGAKTVPLPGTFSVAPVIAGITPVGLDSTADIRLVSVSTTQAVFHSDDSADTRVFSFLVYGSPAGSTGVSTTITLKENTAAWTYVAGTPSATPAVPSVPTGYDAYAQILVHAAETSILQADITYLFPFQPLGSPLAQKTPGTINLPGGLQMKWGRQLSVAADGATTVIAYQDSNFNTATAKVIPAIHTSGATGTGISLQKFSTTASGFSVYVTGGAPSSTVNIDYLAIGY